MVEVHCWDKQGRLVSVYADYTQLPHTMALDMMFAALLTASLSNYYCYIPILADKLIDHTSSTCLHGGRFHTSELT